MKVHEQTEGRLFLILYASDLDGIVDFYTTYFNFKKVSDYVHGQAGGSPDRNLVLALKDNSGAQLHIKKVSDLSQEKMGTLEFYIGSKDIGFAHKILSAHGHSPSKLNEVPWAASFEVKDPVGNIVHVQNLYSEVIELD